MSSGQIANHRVLVVDDNDAIHEDFRKILGGDGETQAELASIEDALFGGNAAAPAVRHSFQVDSALQGEEGFNLIKTAREEGRPYAVAFIDMRMPPGWDGLRTIREMWHADPDLNVVVCTAYSEHSWSEIEAIAGESDRLLVLKKPFEPIEVRRLAATLTAKWNLARRAELKMSELEKLVHSRTVELHHTATHDRLTGLPNRMLFHERLQQALELSRRNKNFRLAVLFLDFDRFKVVNDSLGHQAGDQLLQCVSERLSKILRGTDTVSYDQTASTTARLGGDEFCLLLSNLRNDSDAALVAGRILKELEKPYNLGGHQVQSTASIGIAVSSSGYQQAEDMIRDADTAMYRAKSDGKGRFVIFDQGMHDQAMQRLNVEADLRRAIAGNELVAFYQPIICPKSGRLSGAEALIRWQHPQNGLIEPDKFISIAEESGLIDTIGHWMLQNCCRQLHQWQQRFAGLDFSLSINVSGRQLANPQFLPGLDAVLRETCVSAQDLIFELTETSLVGAADRAIVEKIKARGIRVYLDDFGTGYSSLSLLNGFKLDGLKIDRSFVHDAPSRRNYAAIIQAIVDLAHNLGMRVVAEGVEVREQLTMLQSFNCEEVQGFFFSRPVPVAQFEPLLAKSHATGAWPAQIAVA
jgi:diguanylate cyclase (GGDEF)-like protein